MLILATSLLLFIGGFALVILRVFQPEGRYDWFTAAGSALLAWISVFLWHLQMPFEIVLPAWQPASLFAMPIFFRADGISWALAASVVTVCVSSILTAGARSGFLNPSSWMGTLLLGGMGVLAAAANNPLTLLLIWSLLDLTELVSQLTAVSGEKNSERVAIAFSTRAFGSILLLWAIIRSAAEGDPVTFKFISAGSDMYLILAAGLRLGVLPLHLPYASESSLRRGFGTTLRLTGAISTLALLAKVEIASTNLTLLLTLLTAAAGFYGGWIWLRAQNSLNGRPYWMIGIASLAVLSALAGNPAGTAAWSCVLTLAGAPLFLSTLPDARLNRTILAGIWGLSSLPFSPSAGAWLETSSMILLAAVPIQAMMMSGYIRHALRITDSPVVEVPLWSRIVYPAGILLPVLFQFLLGLGGWDGARQIGHWVTALLTSFLTGGLVWASRRFRIFNPVHAHWIAPESSGVNNLYRWLWSVYRSAARVGQVISQALEGEGSMMWTLLFLLLFIVVIAQGIR